MAQALACDSEASSSRLGRALERFSFVPPIYCVAIAICAGDALGNFRWFAPEWLVAVASILAVAAILGSYRRAGYAVGLIAIAATATMPVRDLLRPHPSAQTIRALPEGQTTTVEGILVAEPEHLVDRTHLMLRALRAAPVGEPMADVTGGVRVTVIDQINPRIGDELAVTSRLRFPRNNGNPGEYDYAGAMARDGIAATMTIPPQWEDHGAIRTIAHHRQFPFSQLQALRDRIAALIDRTLPTTEAGEMRALVIGDRSGIDEDLRNDFARTGMAHLLVISGLHLGSVAAAMFVALRFLMMLMAPGLASRGWANKAGAIGASIAVCAYTAIAGHHLSTVRAMIMVLAYMLAIVLDRASEAIASLALAAIVICLVLPGSTADIGFQLSFASVMAIILGMRRFSAWMKMRKRRGRLPAEPDARAWVLAERPLDYVAVSFWAMLGTAPLTALHFNQVAMVGLLANAVVVPIMGFGATICGLLGSAIGLLWQPGGEWFLWLGSMALRLSNWLAAWFVDWPAAWTHMFTPTPVEMILGYGLILLWLGAPLARIESPAIESKGPSPRSFGWRGASALLLVVLIAVDAAWWLRDRYFNPDLRVTFLSVGEGDAAVVRFPGSKVMLIDAGESYGGYDNGERVVAPYLWSRKILHVDYLVLSHPDADHFGGFGYIAANFSPREFWAPSIASKDQSYATTLIALMEAHVSFITILPVEHSTNIGGVEVRTVADNQPVAIARHNNASALLRLGFGKVGFLFTGDIEAAAEEQFVQQGIDLKATVLKVPHHGSKTSSSASFIAAVHPAVAVISDGYQNHFHFPALQVLERYNAAGVKVLRTDLDGAVMTRVTPDKVNVQSFRGDRLTVSPQ